MHATESPLATRAAACVRRHALDADEAVMLLEMLGLAEPTPVPAAPPRRTRVEELVQAVVDADRLLALREPFTPES